MLPLNKIHSVEPDKIDYIVLLTIILIMAALIAVSTFFTYYCSAKGWFTFSTFAGSL